MDISGAKLIADGLCQTKSIKILNLEKAYLTGREDAMQTESFEGIKALGDAIKTLEALESVNLAANLLGPLSIDIVADSVIKGSSIKFLE